MKKVLVTGATGRVGANVVRRLVEEETAVRAMVMPGDPMAEKLTGFQNVEIIEADLTDQGSVDRAVKGVTHVIHLAAQLIRGKTPVDRFFDINAFGTLRLLEAAARQGGVERFVLTSTDGTYRPGRPSEIPLREGSPQTATDYYGVAKILGERIMRMMHDTYEIPYTVIRFSTVVSPEESLRMYRYSHVRGLFERAHFGKDSNLWEMFDNQPDFIELLDSTVSNKEVDPAVNLIGPTGRTWSMHCADVRDIVQGVLLAYSHPNALYEDFLIAGPQTTPFKEGAGFMAKTFNIPLYTVRMPIDWNLDMDITKARRMLGFNPQWTFERMVLSGIEGASDVIPAKGQTMPAGG